MSRIVFILTLCLLVASPALPSAQAQRPGQNSSLIRNESDLGFDSSGDADVAGSKFGYFLRAKKDTPEEQLAYAGKLLAQDKKKKARKAYRALVKIWPETLEAAQAQLEYARLTRELKGLEAGAEAYEYLLAYYSGSVPHEKTLRELFAIGEELLETPKARFLFFPGFKAPERSIPIFQNIIVYAPRWERAAEVQYKIGLAYKDNFNHEKAISAFDRTQAYYGDSLWAEKAAFQRLLCLEILSEESPKSKRALEDTWVASVLFKEQYPKSEHLPEVLAMQEKMYERRTSMAYEEASFYDRVARRPEAALRAYREFISQFPNSSYSPSVKKRIAELSQELGETPTSSTP